MRCGLTVVQVLLAVLLLTGSPAKAQTVMSAPPPTALIEATALRSVALAERQARDYAASIADLNNALALEPGYVNAYLDRAASKAGQLDYPGAIADAVEALQRAANPAQKLAAWEARSRYMAASGDYAGAAADLRQALPLNPRPAAGWYELASLEARRGNRQLAVQDLDQALAIQPTYGAALRLRGELRRGLGDNAGSAADFAFAGAVARAVQPNSELAAAPDPALPAQQQDVARALALFSRAGGEMRSRDFKGAIADLNEAVKLRPGFGDAFQTRAAAKSSLGDYAGALDDATQALKLANAPSRRVGALAARSAAEASSAADDAALADLKQVLPLTPTPETVWARMAQIERGRQNYAQGLADCNQALAIAPSYTVAYSLRSQLRRDLGDLMGAIADTQEAAGLTAAVPRAGSPVANPAYVLRSSGTRLSNADAFGPAVMLLRRLVKLTPDDGFAWGALGWALTLEINDPEAPLPAPTAAEAQAALERARVLGQTVLVNNVNVADAGGLAAPPETSPANADLVAGKTDFQRGNFKAALEQFEHAAGLDPTSYQAALYAGDACFRLRQNVAAEAWFAKAVAIAPGAETAYRSWGDSLLAAKQWDAAKEKYVQAILADPLALPPWTGGLVKWAVATRHVYTVNGLPPAVRQAITAAVPRLPAGEVDANGGTAWVAYFNARLQWKGNLFRQAFPAATAYRHSLPEEHAALQAVLAQVKQNQAQITKLEKPLGLLQSLDADGLLDAFIVLNDSDTGIEQDYPAYRRQHEADLRRYINMYVVH